MARALESRLYPLFYDVEEPPKLVNWRNTDKYLRGNSGKDYKTLNNFRTFAGSG
jgi:hypothetical protein